MLRSRLSWPLLLLTLTACGSPVSGEGDDASAPPSDDAGAPSGNDAGPRADASGNDAGSGTDAGVGNDAGSGDAGDGGNDAGDGSVAPSPSITSATLGGPSGFTNSTTVALQVQANDNGGGAVTQICVSGTASDGCVAFGNGTINVTLTSGEGAKNVDVTVKNAAGRSSSATTRTITLDVTPPVLTSASINAGALHATARGVTVTFVASDALSGVDVVAIQNPPGAYGNFVSAAGASVAHDLAAGVDGPRSINVKVRDKAGNVSNEVGVSIALDTSAPSAPTGLTTSPATKGRSASPSVKGTAEASTTVRVYAGASCQSAAIVSGTAAAFGGAGLTVTAAANTTSTYSADAVDAAGHVSPCSAAVTYLHDGLAPSTPTLTGTTPASPAASGTPSVDGTGEAGSTITLYTTPDCTGSSVGSATPAGTSYSIPVTSTGGTTTTYYATATDDVGNVSACSSGVAYKNVQLGAVAALYSGRGSWNLYIKRDGTSVFDATNTACVGTETGGYGGCIHAGVMRSLSLPGVTSCTGVTATDALGAFRWRCDASTNPVRVVSVGLQEDKNLSDLLDFATPRFKENVVTASVDGVVTGVSTSTTWFANTVANAGSSTSFSTSGNVYVQTADRTVTGISIGGQRVAYVVQPGVRLAVTGTNGTLVGVNGSFHWIEGDFDASTAFFGFSASGVRSSVWRNVRLQAVGGLYGIFFALSGGTTAQNNFLRRVTVTGFTNGLQTGTGGTNNLGIDLTFYNATSAGIEFQTGGSNTAINVVATSSQNGYTLAAAGNAVVNATVAHNYYGVQATPAGAGCLHRNVVAVNNDAYGLGLNGGDMTIENLVAAHNGSNALTLTGSNYVTGDIRFGSNGAGTATADCGSAPSAFTVSGANCVAAGTSDFGTAARGRSLLTAFLGKVAVDDPASASDTNGGAAFASITDWYATSSRFRAWGRDGAAFPSADNRTRCTAANGPCRIWDWRPAAADAELRGQNVCPSTLAAPGLTWGGVTMLRSSWEVLEDGIGNDNGFCESNEACVFARNKGAYQGSGALVPTTTAGCLSGTGFSGIVGYEYASP